MSNVVDHQKKKNTIIYAYHRMFQTDDGAMILEDLKKACNYNNSSFDENPYNTAFNEGTRSVLLRVLQILESDPEQLLSAVKGNQEGEEYE